MGKAQRIASRHNEDVEDVNEDVDDATDDEQEASEDENEEDDSEDEGEQDRQPGRKEARYRKQRNEYRRELRQVKAELEKVKKGRSSASTDMAMELAFIKAAAAEGVTDVEAAWKLCDRGLLSWEDGDEPQLVGIEDALEKVLDRYPYVAGSTERDADDRRSSVGQDGRVQPPHATTSGRPTNRKKQGVQTIDRAYLEKKYPSLRRQGSHRPPLG
jgi:hypothetical protein